MLSPETMRVLLIISMLGVALIAALYLHRRRLSLTGYLGWGALILLLPFLGPLLVIAAAPGEAKFPARQVHRAPSRRVPVSSAPHPHPVWLNRSISVALPCPVSAVSIFI